MAHIVSDHPHQEQGRPPDASQQSEQHIRLTKMSIISTLVAISLLLCLFTGLLVVNLLQGVELASTRPNQHSTINATAEINRNATLTPTPPLIGSNNIVVPPLQLSGKQYVIYEQQDYEQQNVLHPPDTLYSISTMGANQSLPIPPPTATALSTPGYSYNQAVRPILTSTGKLLYSGTSGIWITDLASGSSRQIAPLANGQMITSMIMSRDGTTIAWSSESIDSTGMIDIYAGPLADPQNIQLKYQQSAGSCPCFRLFSFTNSGNTTLLLTDDIQSHEAVQNGLWSFDLTTSSPRPHLILGEDSQQGPLALAPQGNTLLYSSSEGVVPLPTDKSVPASIATLPYANSLTVGALHGQPPAALNASQIVLPEQHDLRNNAQYHHVTTPLFTPDGHTLIYIVFSNDAQPPFDRHSALYTVQISGSDTSLHVSKPRLLATSPAQLIELGYWLNPHILTFYADNALYALDIQSGAIATLLRLQPLTSQKKTYARLVDMR